LISTSLLPESGIEMPAALTRDCACNRGFKSLGQI
jgi:hypothetical protein